MKYLFLMSLTLLISISQFSFAQTSETTEAPATSVKIDINQAKTRKSLIAFPPLLFVGNASTTKNYQSLGAELYRVIFNDLSVSTYFQFISQNAFLEDTTKTGIRPLPEPGGFKFDSWKQIGSEFLIRASFSTAGNDLHLEAYIYHVARGALVLGKKYRGEVKLSRRIAHTFANDVLLALTGERGPFLSRVAVASDRGDGKHKEIYLMDWDGANVEKITNHKSVAISPAWSPDGSKVAYTAFVQRAKTKTRNADMFIYEVPTGNRWLVSYRQGINSGASFTPDGQNVLLTVSQQGTPDIYRMTLKGDLVKRITNGPRGAMNVEPMMSPDSSKIAFSSDRSGKPMVYIMNSDGTNVKRVTFAGDYNATPVWSPDGKKLAFAGWSDGHFDIFTMDADGTNMVRITSAKKSNGKWANNEDPSFSPDGRLIMFTSNRTGKNQIYVANLDGSEERRITSDSKNYFKPKWSKNLD